MSRDFDAIVSDRKAGKQIWDYKVGNLLVRIAAIDKKRSSIEYVDEDILSINSLVLDGNRIGSYSFFRLQEFASIIIVREDVIQVIKQNRCTGARFVPTEEFRV